MSAERLNLLWGITMASGATAQLVAKLTSLQAVVLLLYARTCRSSRVSKSGATRIGVATPAAFCSRRTARTSEA